MSFLFGHQVYSHFPLVSQVSCVAETINVGVENLFEFQTPTLPRPQCKYAAQPGGTKKKTRAVQIKSTHLPKGCK